jgi:hypothetical protein
MKISIFLAVILTTASALAGPISWSDLDADYLYRSAFKIEMADGVVIHPDQQLLLLEKYSLGTPLVFFKFRDMACEDLSLKTELILFNPDPDTADDSSVGMSYETNCEIDVYVETKDYYDKSIAY